MLPRGAKHPGGIAVPPIRVGAGGHRPRRTSQLVLIRSAEHARGTMRSMVEGACSKAAGLDLPPSLLAKRSNPVRPRGLDCFVAPLLAMTRLPFLPRAVEGGALPLGANNVVYCRCRPSTTCPNDRTSQGQNLQTRPQSSGSLAEGISAARQGSARAPGRPARCCWSRLKAIARRWKPSLPRSIAKAEPTSCPRSARTTADAAAAQYLRR